MTTRLTGLMLAKTECGGEHSKVLDTAPVWSSAFRRCLRRIARARLKAELQPGSPRLHGGSHQPAYFTPVRAFLISTAALARCYRAPSPMSRFNGFPFQPTNR